MSKLIDFCLRLEVDNWFSSCNLAICSCSSSSAALKLGSSFLSSCCAPPYYLYPLSLASRCSVHNLWSLAATWEQWLLPTGDSVSIKMTKKNYHSRKVAPPQSGKNYNFLKLSMEKWSFLKNTCVTLTKRVARKLVPEKKSLLTPGQQWRARQGRLWLGLVTSDAPTLLTLGRGWRITFAPADWSKLQAFSCFRFLKPFTGAKILSKKTYLLPANYFLHCIEIFFAQAPSYVNQ